MYSVKSNKQKNKSYEKSIMVSSSDLYYSLATWNVRSCTRNGNRKFGTRFIGNRNHCGVI